MGNKTRLFITIFMIIFSVYLLIPTYKWYFVIPEKDKILLTLSPQELATSGLNDQDLKRIEDLRKLSKQIINLGLDLKGGIYIVLKADFSKLDNYIEQDKEEAIQRVLLIIKNRIDQFGVSEPKITRMGKDLIAIELPGAKDFNRVKNIIIGQGRLTFQLVDVDTVNLLRNTPGAIDEKGNIVRLDLIPEDSHVLGIYKKDKYGNYVQDMATVVKKKVELDGTYLKKVNVINGQWGPEVAFTLSNEGASIFYEVTKNNVNKPLAIILDNKVLSMPMITEPINSPNATIQGNFTAEEAFDLALILKAGSFPVPIVIAEQNEVGPTLGQDSIKRGIKAGLIGGVLVLIFAVIYYKLIGVLIDILLALNIFFLIAFLAAFSYTLTLPGIAGIILNIGMGIDAFVIIYERIKDELRTGKPPYLAVSMGYDKAFLTIFDSNLTTLIASITLAQLGSGPIRGFAVTLSIGIVINMIVVLIISRLIMTTIYKDESKKKMAI
jgi:preprotein translocase subunit SecD